jgi:hypothetical protein
LNPGFLDFVGSQQGGVFYEAAEFLFADVVMGAFAGGEVFEGFVFHFQPLQMHDLEVKIALIINLALQQFHRNNLRHGQWNWPVVFVVARQGRRIK